MKRSIAALMGLLWMIMWMNASAADDMGFSFRGHPLKPTCVYLFNGNAPGQPIIREINIHACELSRVLNKTMLRNKAGQIYFYKNNKNLNQGAYYYQIIGKTEQGYYVLHTYSSNGKGNILDGLLLIRLKTQATPVYRLDGTIANIEVPTAILQGYINGGDRCSGGIKSVEIQGNKIILQKYPSKNAVAQCYGAQTFTLSLQ